MIVKRKYFSDKKSDGEKAAKRIGLAAGGFLAGNTAMAMKVLKTPEKELNEEGRELSKKLKKIAEEQGTPVLEKESPEILKEFYLKEKPKASEKEIKEVTGKLLRNPSPYYCPTKESEHINIAKGPERADFFAHELGHSKHHFGRDGSKAGKLAHKIDRVTRRPKLRGGTIIGSGLASGIQAGIKEEKGEKVSTLNKLTPALAAAAINLPTLGAEIAASRKGHKMLKASGASEKYLDHYRKQMKSALNSYGTVIGLDTAVGGYGGREVGKIIGRRIERENKKKDKK